MSLSKLVKERQFSQAIAVLLLLFLLVIGAVPGYLAGKWQWQQPPSITTLKQLKEIRNHGLQVPGWRISEQVEQQVGEHAWSLQLMEKENSSQRALMLLLPQNGPRNQPQVEWTEMEGWGRARWGKWDVAQLRTVNFTAKSPETPNSSANITARFFRASTPESTFAALQWYAWRQGGHPSPLKWFTTDQIAQWHRQRAAWVAVSIFLPMEPLGDIEKSWNEIKSLGETVQATLIKSYL
ncbi:hypothetical protein IJ00_12705 [Calothrix sp. 336/3]|nr:hypothetical protein IJ00_12705 [Calothrix sp. 336/3]